MREPNGTIKAAPIALAAYKAKRRPSVQETVLNPTIYPELPQVRGCARVSMIGKKRTVEVKTVKIRKSCNGQITLSRPTMSVYRATALQTFDQTACAVSHDGCEGDKGDKRGDIHDNGDVSNQIVNGIEHILNGREVV